MRKSSFGLLVAVLALVLTACTSAVPAGAAATVNGLPIDAELFERLVRAQVNTATAGGTSVEPEQVADLQRQVLTQMIRTEIVRQGAADLGLDVTDEELDERWEQETIFAGSEEALLQTIADLGFTVDEAYDQLRAIVLQDKLVEQFSAEIDVSDGRLRELYDQRLDSNYRTAKSAHILVETEEEANEILGLLEGGADFAELAIERSVDTFSGEQGGDLGFNARGQFVPEFDDAVWNADVGELIGPVETQFGFHIIRVDEFQTTSFADARDSLRDEVVREEAQAAQQDFFQRINDEAVVEVDSRYGVFDPLRGEVVSTDVLTGDPTG